MHFTPVDSSNIAAIGFDQYPLKQGQENATGTLAVRFISGSEYSYRDVPANLAADLFLADSFGKFFNANIRGKYDAVKAPDEVTGADTPEVAPDSYGEDGELDVMVDPQDEEIEGEEF